jgi:hypothetical protein
MATGIKEYKNPYEREGSIMEQSIVEKILFREGRKAQFYNECYQLLPKDKLEFLLNLRPETQQIIIQYIQGKRPLASLPEEENDLMLRIQNDYSLFLQNQSNNDGDETKSSFQLHLDQLERAIYNNFFHRVSFNILEEKEDTRDKQLAAQIKQKLFLPN